MKKKMSIIPTVSKIYKDVNSKRPESYYNYEKLQINWGMPDPYEIVKRVGRGKYSEVFEGFKNFSGEKQMVIIKVLKPVRFKNIKREIKILQNLKNGTNIISLIDIVREPNSKLKSFIFENINGSDLKKASIQFDIEDIKYYLFELLKALNYCHSMGIIHRDVKPRNIMVNTDQKKLRLIDWGLSEFYHPGTEYNVRVATRSYKGPELLVNYRFYDYSLDMWSVGCVLAGMIFRKDPFFKGENNVNQLVKIARVLGSKELYQYVKKYEAFEVEEVQQIIAKKWPKQQWDNFINENNRHLATKEALDLLENLFVYDHQKRFTALEAMAHPFFDSVRPVIK